MNLCIDIGNTFEKLALFDQSGQRYFTKRIEISNDLIDELVSKYSIAKAIISTTKKKDSQLIDHLRQKVNLLILGDDTLVPVINKYKTPKTLGKDRMAVAVAACKLYPNQNNIVFTAGTCLTSNFINKEKEFLGGNISPGITMRIKAMNHFTANLPLVDATYSGEILGRTTEEALQNGAVLGAICEFESFIERIFDKYGKSNIILTGGEAFYFDEVSKYKIFAHSNLVLMGLNEIINFNA